MRKAGFGVWGARSCVLGVVLIALIAAGGCAPRTAAAPGAVPPAAPRFPDLPVPIVPSELAASEAAEQHQRAWNRLQSGDVRGAERDFNALAATGFYPASAGLGFVNVARKDYADAITHFDRALAANASYVPALLGKGEALLGQDEQALALEVFEKALSADPSLTDVRSRVEVLRFRAVQQQVSRAQAAARAGRLDEAEAAYERAIAASPESGFLYRELAGVEQQRGNFEEALAHARKAVELDRNDAAAYAITGSILEGMGDLLPAAEAFERAAAIDNSAAYRARAAELRRKADEAALPEEFRAIPTAPSITRGELAALFGRRLERLVATAPQRSPVVITDIRDHWAHSYIQSVTRARILDAFPNHTFQPNATVRRGDFAQAIARALNIIGARRPDLAGTWRGARPTFTDLSTGHLAYPAVAMAVASGVMTAPDGEFGFTRPISGAEALEALDRLRALAR